MNFPSSFVIFHRLSLFSQIYVRLYMVIFIIFTIYVPPFTTSLYIHHNIKTSSSNQRKGRHGYTPIDRQVFSAYLWEVSYLVVFLAT